MTKHVPTLTKGITAEEFAHKLECLEEKVEQIDKKVSRKADEIVSLQILEHRRELEEIYEVIKSIDLHIQHIETELSEVENYQKGLNQQHLENTTKRGKKNKRKSQKVTPLFS